MRIWFTSEAFEKTGTMEVMSVSAQQIQTTYPISLVFRHILVNIPKVEFACCKYQKPYAIIRRRGCVVTGLKRLRNFETVRCVHLFCPRATMEKEDSRVGFREMCGMFLPGFSDVAERGSACVCCLELSLRRCAGIET